MRVPKIIGKALEAANDTFGRYRKSVMRFEDGTPMVCGRPDKPERVKELVNEANNNPEGKIPGASADKVWADLEEKLNDECGPYTFVGYPVKARKAANKARPVDQTVILIDAQGNRIGEMETGDSFMHPSTFMEDA